MPTSLGPHQSSHHNHRPPWRLTLANRILARPFVSMRRKRRVSSCTRTVPIPGSLTDRGRASPTLITGLQSLGCLLRSRNDCLLVVFFLNRGNPTCRPLRPLRRQSDHTLSARPQSTAASSNTCL